MKRLLINFLVLFAMAIPMWSAVDGKFTYSYPDATPENPYSLDYQYSVYDLKESPIEGWRVMYLTKPVTLAYNITSEAEQTVEVVFDPTYMELQDIVIPDKVIDSDTGKEYTVTAIGKMAFDDCPEIRSVIMSNSITRIEDYAFNMCTNKILHKIGYIKFSENLTHIGNYAFKNCHNLTTGHFTEGDQWPITVRNFVTNVDYPHYGYGARLTGLEDYLLLPASVKYIGKHAFEGCYFEREDNEMKYGLCKVKIPNPSCVIDDYAFAGCRFLELVTIGEELNYNGLKYPNPDTTEKGRIGDYAFADCNLMRLDIPSSIASIGENAFMNCFTKQAAKTSRTQEGRVYFDDLNWFYPRALFNNEDDYWHGWNFETCDISITQRCEKYLNRWHTNIVTIYSDKTDIGKNAFAENPQLAQVIINGTAGEIGSGAFRDCANLTVIELPADLTKVSSGMFKNCRYLNNVKIPQDVTEIGDSAFYNCVQLYNIELPSKLEKVNPYTFYGCAWLDLHELPEGVKSIGEYAFCGCRNLGEFTIPGSVTTIGDFAFADCNEHLFRRFGPDDVMVYGLTKVTIGDGVTSIGAHAFDGCRHLGQIEFGNSLTTIGDYAFQNCMSCDEEVHDESKYAPSNVVIPENITSIGKGAFQGCTHLPSVELSAGMTELPDYAFAYCSDLSSVTNSSTIETISKTAFLGCYNLEDLDNLYAAEGLIDGIYYNAERTEVIAALPNIQVAEILPGVTKINDDAFADCGALSEVQFPESLEYIGSRAFKNCVALQYAELMNIEMGDSVYAGCTGIESVGLRADFTRQIRDNWFAGCFNMASIEVEPGNPVYSSEYGLLLDVTGETLLRAPSGIDWLEFPETVTKIGDWACSNCILLDYLIIPETVTHIGSHAFDGCYMAEEWHGIEVYSGLRDVEIKNPAINIGDYAFNKCKNLNTIYWMENPDIEATGTIGAHFLNGCISMDFDPDCFTIASAAVDTIKPYAFANVPKLEEIELPQTLVTIGDHAFENCEDLSSVVFPDGLKTIGNSAFKSSALKALYLTENIKEIGDSAFMDCVKVMALTLPSSLSKINPYTFYKCFSGALFNSEPNDDFVLSVEIPKGVKSIGEYAFYGCTVDEKMYNSGGKHTYSDLFYFYNYGLSSLTIGEDVETIGAHAFDGCSNLLEVKMGNAVTSIGDYAFNNCFKETFQGVREVEYTMTGIVVNKEGLTACPTVWGSYDNVPMPVTLPDGLNSLGEGAFNGCANLPDINFPGSLTAIPALAFNGCEKLPAIELSESLTTIGETAFGGCKGVKEIHIPASLEEGSRVFVDCDSAYSVYYYAEVPKAFDEAFFSPKVYASKDAVLNTPKALLENVKGKTPWALFYRIVAKDETLVHLERALETKNGLRFRILSNKPIPYCEVAGPAEPAEGPTTYDVPEYVNNIDETSDYFGKPYKVIRIGNDAFENDLTLVGIHIPESVFDIGQEAFNGCKNLPEITLPPTITNMGERAFANCYGLTYFEVPPLITRLNPEVLRDCRGLYSVKMHGDIEELCTGSLMDCRHLRKLEGSENWKLRLIDDYALKNCIELEEINIPEGVIKIGKEAMYYCQKLNTVSLPTTLEQLGENTFDDCEVLNTIKVYTETPPKTVGERHLTDQHCKIYVQAKSLDAYKEFWKVHEQRIEPGIIVSQPVREEMPEFILDTSCFIASAMPLSGQTMTWSTYNQIVAKEDEVHDGTINIRAVGPTHVKVTTDQNYYHECDLDVYPQLADANWDASFDISDAVSIANYVVVRPEVLNNWWETYRTDIKDLEEWMKFYTVGADVNKDGVISISDASAAVKIIMAQTPGLSAVPPRLRVCAKNGVSDALLIGNVPAFASDDHVVPVGLQNSTDYVALQADIRVPEGTILSSIAAGPRAASHVISTRRIDDRTLRVVLFDLNSTPFADSTEPLLLLSLRGESRIGDEIEISNVVASDASATSHGLSTTSGYSVSSIKDLSETNVEVHLSDHGLTICNAAGNPVAIHTLDGYTLRTLTPSSAAEFIPLPAGIYVISVDSHTFKIALP